MNRITENEKILFSDHLSNHALLDLIGYASRATKTARSLGDELNQYADLMEKLLKTIETRQSDKQGIKTQCNRLPRHQEKKD